MNTKKNRPVYFYDSCIDNDCLYFVSVFHDGFFYFDLKTKELKYIGDSDMEDSNSNLNIKVTKIDQSIFSVPNFGHCLFEYDLKKKELLRHGFLFEKYKDEPLKRVFQDICKFDEKIYLIPRSYPAILEVNLTTDEIINEYGEWTKEFSDIERLWLTDKVMVGSSVYMVQAWSNRILEYDLAKHQYAVHFIGASDEEFSYIRYDGKNFWLFCRNRLKIILWNKENGSVQIIDSFPDEMRKAMEGKLEHEALDDMLSYVYIDSGFVYLVSSLQPVVLQINMADMSSNLIYLHDVILPKHIEWVRPFSISGMDDNHIYCMTGDGKLIIYDKTLRKIGEEEISADFDYDNVILKHMRKALLNGKSISEVDLMWAKREFRDIFDEVLEWVPKDTPTDMKDCGKKIYQSMF